MMSITTPFGFDTTAQQAVAGLDLAGQRAVVTGASSGIGVATAQALASAGAAVTLAVRNVAAGAEVSAAIAAETGNPRVTVERLDLADLDSIRGFAGRWQGPLDILINNAGIMALPELTLNAAGQEQQFATNHLGHFALALGLHGALASAGRARIVSLSSRGHLRSPVVFEDIHFAHRPYAPFLAYGQSKTANILFAVEATRRWAGDGITANAVHPGVIVETNLSRYMGREALNNLLATQQYSFKTVEQGAATSVVVATSPLLAGIGGRYFEDCNEALPADLSQPELPLSGVAPYALDPDNALRLWDASLAMIA
jgi:NAD(P)-dependent dehydrogenase (short-subunit alcohol dehydrogenase family)